MGSVSVVIPAYNRGDRIARTLRSVYAQTLLPDEVIVVDDGSTDGTYELVRKEFPEVKLYRQENQGASAARNLGIEKSHGDFIAFLDSDDVWLPDKLRVQMKVFREHPELGLLATRKFKNTEDYPIRPVESLQVRFHPFTAFLKRTTVNTPTIVVPRKVFETVGRFDLSLKTSEDWDLWARIAYRYPVARVEQPLTAVFESPNSISLSRKVKYVNDIEVISRWDPKRPGSYDIEGRLNPLLFQRYLFGFAFIRSTKLIRHCGAQEARDYLKLIERKIRPSPLFMLLLRILVGLACLCLPQKRA